MTAPFDLNKLDSWFLLFVGLAFATIAFYEGFRWADPTPGYVMRHRRAEEATEDYLHARSDLDASGRAVRDRVFNVLQKESERVRYRVEGLRNDVNIKRMIGEKAQNFFHHAVETCNTMLAAYRTENRRHRSTPPPAYFQKPWRLQDPSLSVGDLSLDLVRVEERQAEWDSVATDLEPLRRSLEAEYEEFVRRARELRARDEEFSKSESSSSNG
jgi:hypothetical protein